MFISDYYIYIMSSFLITFILLFFVLFIILYKRYKINSMILKKIRNNKNDDETEKK